MDKFLERWNSLTSQEPGASPSKLQSFTQGPLSKTFYTISQSDLTELTLDIVSYHSGNLIPVVSLPQLFNDDLQELAIHKTSDPPEQ